MSSSILIIGTFMILTRTLEQDVLDVELCTYALTLVDKTLYEIDDQPTFYDQTDYMEDLGIDRLEDDPFQDQRIQR